MRILSVPAGTVNPSPNDTRQIGAPHLINNKPYYDKRAIAEFIGYSGRRCNRAISRILRRYPDLKGDTIHARVVRVEGNRTVARRIELYDPLAAFFISSTAFNQGLPRRTRAALAEAKLFAPPTHVSPQPNQAA